MLHFVVSLTPLWRRRLCEGLVHPLDEFQITRPDDISLATPRWERKHMPRLSLFNVWDVLF